MHRFYSFFFFFWPRRLQDSSSLTKEGTQATVVIKPSPNPWASRELGKQRIQIALNKSREKRTEKRDMENIK